MAFNDFERGFPFREETITNVQITEFENGVEQRRDFWGGKKKKRFTVNFKVNSLSEIKEIEDFFESQQGPLATFSFTNPLDSIEYTVRFEENSFEVERQHFGVYNAKVRLLEVF